MKMIEIEALSNGAHRNQTYYGTLPPGWAVIPDDMAVPSTFPFVEVEVAEVVHHKEPVEEGQEQEPYTVPTVVSMTEGIMPEPTPKPEPGPSQLDRIEAQITYTAMMTDTLLEV